MKTGNCRSQAPSRVSMTKASSICLCGSCPLIEHSLGSSVEVNKHGKLIQSQHQQIARSAAERGGRFCAPDSPVEYHARSFCCHRMPSLGAGPCSDCVADITSDSSSSGSKTGVMIQKSLQISGQKAVQRSAHSTGSASVLTSLDTGTVRGGWRKATNAA